MAVPMHSQSRQYDIVLIGATGYTGRLTAHFITRQLPPDLNWAIAGRSEAKLYDLAAQLRLTNPGLSEPAIEIIDLEREEQVNQILQRATVCISVVSYSKVGTVVVDACIKHGTDYVDTCGNEHLIKGWIEKYHEKAETSGVALIHACGTFSGPQDVLSWLAVRELKESSGQSTKEVVLSLKELPSDPSGGTFHSMMESRLNNNGPEKQKSIESPWCLSPIQGTKTSAQANWLGLRKDSHLGMMLEGTFGSKTNIRIVHRSWGLLQDKGSGYGDHFQYNEYQSVGSSLRGFLKLLQSIILGTLISSSLMLRLLSNFMPPLGSGPDVKKAEKQPVKMEVIAIPEVGTSRALASFDFPSGSYHTTALFLAQAAASLLHSKTLDRRSFEGRLRGGCLTPAMLGRDFVERLTAGGATIEVTTKITTSGRAV